MVIKIFTTSLPQTVEIGLFHVSFIFQLFSFWRFLLALDDLFPFNISRASLAAHTWILKNSISYDYSSVFDSRVNLIIANRKLRNKTITKKKNTPQQRDYSIYVKARHEGCFCIVILLQCNIIWCLLNVNLVCCMNIQVVYIIIFAFWLCYFLIAQSSISTMAWRLTPVGMLFLPEL